MCSDALIEALMMAEEFNMKCGYHLFCYEAHAHDAAYKGRWHTIPLFIGPPP